MERKRNILVLESSLDALKLFSIRMIYTSLCGAKANAETAISTSENDHVISDEKNEFVAQLYLNNKKIGFIFCEDNSTLFINKIEELDVNKACDYLVCCSGIKDTEGSIFRYRKETWENYGEDYCYDLNPENRVSVIEKVVQQIKYFCGVSEYAISAEEINKLRDNVIDYIQRFYVKDKELVINGEAAQEAFETFNDEWGKINPFLADRDDEHKIKSLYGLALLIYAAAVKVLSTSNSHFSKEVKKLQIYIDDYSRRGENKYYFDIKSDLYYLLCSCLIKIDKEKDSIKAVKKHIFYSICLFTHNTYDKTQAYSFRKCSTFLYQALVNNTINITSPVEFNDPFDCPILSFENNEDEVISLRNRAYSEGLKIACFSSNIMLPHANPDNEWETIRNKKKIQNSVSEFKNPLMWAHYADSHKGICIKYVFPPGFSKTGGDASTVVSVFGDVRYSNESQSNIQKKNWISFKEAFFLKGEEWKYENELRLFCFDFDGKGKYDFYGETSKCIEAVFFGLRCSEEDKKTILNLLSKRRFEKKKMVWNEKLKRFEEHKSLHKIRCYQMEKDPEHFGRLKAIRIKDNPKKSNTI